MLVIGYHAGGSTVLGIAKDMAAVRRLAHRFLLSRPEGRVEYFRS